MAAELQWCCLNQLEPLLRQPSDHGCVHSVTLCRTLRQSGEQLALKCWLTRSFCLRQCTMPQSCTCVYPITHNLTCKHARMRTHNHKNPNSTKCSINFRASEPNRLPSHRMETQSMGGFFTLFIVSQRNAQPPTSMLEKSEVLRTRIRPKPPAILYPYATSPC